MTNCKIFSQDFLEFLNEEIVFNIFLMADTAHLHLPGCVYKQNFHYLAAENLHQLYQHPLYSEKVTFWCGVACFGLIGPYFSEDSAGVEVTVTSSCYVEMLCNFRIPEFHHHRIYLHAICSNDIG
jgi:hypothetical protein